MNDSPVDCQNREWTEPQRDEGDRRMAVDEVVAERITIPPTSLSLGRLPLHKGGTPPAAAKRADGIRPYNLAKNCVYTVGAATCRPDFTVATCVTAWYNKTDKIAFCKGVRLHDKENSRIFCLRGMLVAVHLLRRI